MFFGFFFLIALVVIGVLAMPSRYHHHHMMHPMHPLRTSYEVMPEEILRARYARGEISHEEFVQMMHDLHAS